MNNSIHKIITNVYDNSFLVFYYSVLGKPLMWFVGNFSTPDILTLTVVDSHYQQKLLNRETLDRIVPSGVSYDLRTSSLPTVSFVSNDEALVVEKDFTQFNKTLFTEREAYRDFIYNM